MKAAVCIDCSDILTPYHDWETNRKWRWCACGHMSTRWQDGRLGIIEVTAMHGLDHVRVLGLNNLFLFEGARLLVRHPDAWWRKLHEQSCDNEHIEPHYLFNEARRNCWAVLIRVGETGDVVFVPYKEASLSED